MRWTPRKFLRRALVLPIEIQDNEVMGVCEDGSNRADPESMGAMVSTLGGIIQSN